MSFYFTRRLDPLQPGPALSFPYATYDIETISKDDPTFQMCGFYDGKRYSCFRSMFAFLDHVLRPEYAGWRFFAHYGGRFDVAYVFEQLRGMGETFDFYCSSGAVIAFSLRRQVEGKSLEWRFVDSFRLLPRSFATLAKSFNVEHQKLAPDYSSWIYNRNDCIGLYEVLQKFFGQHEICSETVASHAMRVFRAYHQHAPLEQVRLQVEQFIRRGYYGGRCEVYRYDLATVNKYDINSQYPTAMCGPVPVEHESRTRRLPDHDDGHIGFYLATVDYPRDIYIPCLPYHAKKLYFPVGEMTAVWSSMELRQAIEDGAAVKIHRGELFRTDVIFSDYVMALHAGKQQAEAAGQDGLRLIYKLLLNSLYGKWGQRRLRRAFASDPGTARMTGVDGNPRVYPIEKTPEIVWYWADSKSRHILPHIAATITARARLLQLRYLRAGCFVYYTDTDSVFTTGTLPAGTELGEMKFEGSGRFQAVNLKEYTFDGATMVKGVPLTKVDPDTGDKKRDDAMARLYFDGWCLPGKRRIGFVEALRAGVLTTIQVPTKRVQGVPFPKRRRVGDDTRPLTVEEILEEK